MSIAAYSVEADTAKELKKGSFKMYHQKTPPTNVVLLDIYETDTDEVKEIKRLVNQMRLELGNSTDIIKIEPETALFNILYTKKEIDTLMVSTGKGFNLPLFLNSVLIAGANMIKLRSDGERVTVERYQEFAENTLDNFDYVARKFNEYAEKFKTIDAQLNDHDDAIAELTGELYNTNQNVSSLTGRVDVLEDTVSQIESCECDKQWMRFMKQNFQEGIDDEEIEVKGNLNLNGHDLSGLTEITTHGGVLNINGSLYVPNHPVTARNLPAELTFRHNGLKQNDYITDDGIVDYNTYGKWFQPCDIEAFGSIDVDNRLRINTLNDDKTKITKTVDVGATLEDLDYRIEQIESGGGSGGGFWKINPPRIQTLPGHQTLETYDFTTKASNVQVRNLDNDITFVYFPDLTIDISYDRAQFIEIKVDNRTYYISTKNNQMEIPMIVNYTTYQEETVSRNDINNIGILWKKQTIENNRTVDGNVNQLGLFYQVYYETKYKEDTLIGSVDHPLKIILQEYNSSKELYRTTSFILTDEFDTNHDPIKSNENQDITLNITGDPALTKGLVYYISGVDCSVTSTCKWTFSQHVSDVSVDEYVTKRIKNHTIQFSYTPDRDKIINNEPVTITSTEMVKNDTAIQAPNAFDLHIYGGVKNYEVRLDKLINDPDSVVSFNKITFKDFQIGGDYVGPVFTIYFGTTRFMMNNEQILTPISCYFEEDGRCTTDKLYKKDGFWTTERVECDVPCFLWSKTCPITLQDAYNTGEITIKYIPRQSTMSTKHDVICREVLADNSMELYRATTANFYNPKTITELEQNMVLTGPLETTTEQLSMKADTGPNDTYITPSKPLMVGDEIYIFGGSNDITYKIETLEDLENLSTDIEGRYHIPGTNYTDKYVLVYYNRRTVTNSSTTYYVIDFGYTEDSDEFKQLPEGFRFRFYDPVFSYTYEATKENNQWNYKYGNLHTAVATNRFSTGTMINYTQPIRTAPKGPCIIMNNSNEIALTYLVKHCLGHNVSGWENLWKALWNDSRSVITVDGPLDVHKDQTYITNKEEGKNQYCSIVTEQKNGFRPENNKEYPVTISLKINTENLDVDLKFEYIFSSYRDEGLEMQVTVADPVYDCYEVLNFSQHKEITAEYSSRGRGLRFYASPDFLLWSYDIHYEKGTNIFRFLYDHDYVQIEPRPEACSALMTDKNIITDGIIVAQNLETHLHSLNQVANVSDQTIQRLQYTDAVLGEIIGNLAALNDFVRITIMTDFICLGFSGLMGIVKFGEGIMKNGLRSTLRLDELPAISTAVRNGNKYIRVGEGATDLVQDARVMELVARDSIRTETTTINTIARDISEEAAGSITRTAETVTEEATTISRTARDTIREEAATIETEANRLVHDISEDWEINIGGSWESEASEVSWSSTGSIELVAEDSMELEAPVITNRVQKWILKNLFSQEDTFELLSETEAQSFGRLAGDYIMGLFHDAGQGIKKGLGLVFNRANIAQQLGNMYWIMDTFGDAIMWSVQFGANIYEFMRTRENNSKLEVYFTPDKFIWSVVDANNIRTEHAIVGIAKYNEPAGWDDSKLITGQALLHNYYNKAEIDAKIAGNGEGVTGSYAPLAHTHDTINNDLTVNGTVRANTGTTNSFFIMNPDLSSGGKVAVGIGKSDNDHTCGAITFTNSSTPEFGLGFWWHDHIISCKCKSKQTTPDIYLKGNTTVGGNITANNIYDKTVIDERTLITKEVHEDRKWGLEYHDNTATYTAPESLSGQEEVYFEIDLDDGSDWVCLYITFNGNSLANGITFYEEDGKESLVSSITYDDSTFTVVITTTRPIYEAYNKYTTIHEIRNIPVIQELQEKYCSQEYIQNNFPSRSQVNNMISSTLFNYYNKDEITAINDHIISLIKTPERIASHDDSTSFGFENIGVMKFSDSNFGYDINFALSADGISIYNPDKSQVFLNIFYRDENAQQFKVNGIDYHAKIKSLEETVASQQTLINQLISRIEALEVANVIET